MRKTILTTILVLILLTLMGCGGKTYTFNYSFNQRLKQGQQPIVTFFPDTEIRAAG